MTQPDFPRTTDSGDDEDPDTTFSELLEGVASPEADRELGNDYDVHMFDEDGPIEETLTFQPAEEDEAAMDTGEDGVRRVRSRKRRRPGYFDFDEPFGDEREKLIDSQERLRRMVPYTEQVSAVPKLPAEQEPPPGRGAGRAEFFAIEDEAVQKYATWRYERDKDEIRQLLRINRANQIRARETARRIELLSQSSMPPSAFVDGVRLKNRSALLPRTTCRTRKDGFNPSFVDDEEDMEMEESLDDLPTSIPPHTTDSPGDEDVEMGE